MESGVTTRRASKRKSSSSVADTIEVKQNVSRSNNPGGGSKNAPETIGQEKSSTRNSPSVGPNRSWARKGKEPAGLAESDSDYDYVEEWEFEDDTRASDYEDQEVFSDDDAKSVISLSSEVSASEQDLPERPWQKFDDHARRHYEIMFCNITAHPMHGTWDFTEDYQREKDIEMLRYMEDFPLKDWLISQEEAGAAYYRLLERTRWRSMGTRIYGHDRLTQPPPPHPAQNMHRQQQQMPPPQMALGPQHTQPQMPQQGQRQAHQYMQQQQGPALSQQQRVLSHMGPPHSQPGVLPSQPYAEPVYPMHQGQPPPGIGRPVGPPMTYGMPAPGYAGSAMSPYGAFAGEQLPRPRQGRAKKETPIATTPPPPPPTPPYEVRIKPSETRKGPGKSGRKPARRQAEAEEFPWTRQLNFPEEKATAMWDETIYDPAILMEMRATRERNAPTIDLIDSRLQETQRKRAKKRSLDEAQAGDHELTVGTGIARAAKKTREKNQQKGENSSDVEVVKKERKKRGGQPKGDAADSYHSGAYSFASEEDEKKAKEMGFAAVDEALEAGMAGKLTPQEMGRLTILWSPGKKGMTENLEQAKFTVRDNVLTRKQLDKTPILTKRAAECIIDFCPDMLWRGMLLRITSEGGQGNKDVRDRFCLNGCYCDKATITKRISAALGQKQVQPKSKGYQDGELEWYEENVKDFTHYIDYFGMRTSHRNMLKIQLAGDKRRAKYENNNKGKAKDKDATESSSEAEVTTTKRAKLGSENPTSEANATGESEDARDDGEEDGNDSGEETDDSNAVSLQDSDILDRMDED